MSDSKADRETKEADAREAARLREIERRSMFEMRGPDRRSDENKEWPFFEKRRIADRRTVEDRRSEADRRADEAEAARQVALKQAALKD